MAKKKHLKCGVIKMPKYYPRYPQKKILSSKRSLRVMFEGDFEK